MVRVAQGFEQKDPVVLLFKFITVRVFFPPLPSLSVSFLILFNDFPNAIGRGPRRDCFPLLRGKQE